MQAAYRTTISRALGASSRTRVYRRRGASLSAGVRGEGQAGRYRWTFCAISRASRGFDAAVSRSAAVWASMTNVARLAPESFPVCCSPIMTVRETAPAAIAVADIVSNRRSRVRERIQIGDIAPYIVPATFSRMPAGWAANRILWLPCFRMVNADGSATAARAKIGPQSFRNCSPEGWGERG
jgi:hypothetical protein